jgi:membrane-bound serine protease (ClpP class)
LHYIKTRWLIMDKKFILAIFLFAVIITGAAVYGAEKAAGVTQAAKSQAAVPAVKQAEKAQAAVPSVKPADKVNAPAASRPVFIRLNVEGVIDVANADYLIRGVELAEKENDEGVLVVMQTPGGLDRSMRRICEKFLASKVPVICYVSPKGSRAASAGVFILLSSHVAAMAEGTNIGTAHPVDFQGNSVSEKITNDAVAYIKNLARLKGRNEQWAGDAILKNISSSEIDALKLKVIDVTAKDIDELMKKIDRKKIKVNETDMTLNTAGYELKPVAPSAKHRFLHALSDPNIVYVLFLIGIYGLIYELANAGTAVLPGIAGAIAIVLAFTGFESLPINTAGVILIFLSAVLFFIDMTSPTHGVLTAGGIASLIIGSLLLFPNRAMGEEWAVSYVLMGGMILFTIAFFVLVVAVVVKSHRSRVITGMQSVLGKNGVATTEINAAGGVVNVGGEDWQAVSDEAIPAREIIEVLEVNGLKLKVKKVARKAG